MKTLLKIVGGVVLVLVVAVGSLLAYVRLALPKVQPADQSLKIESSPERVKRGEYLTHHVAGCIGCHSIEDWTVYGHPVVPGTEFAGGEPIFDGRIGLPGRLTPKNLTPYNLKHYSDGELVRVLRTGVRNNGEPLFPFMPYQHLAHMTQEDLYSVIAYLRTLPETVKDVPDHELEPPLNFIVRTIPKDAGPYDAPVDPRNTVAYGKYLVEIGSCTDCHTPMDPKTHGPVAGMYLAGGFEFNYLNNKLERHPGGGKLRTPNITPDAETGIGSWTKAQFIGRFAEWRGAKGKAKQVKLNLDQGDYMEVMPYLEISGMTDADLGAIYDYLRTVPAVHVLRQRFDPPKI